MTFLKAILFILVLTQIACENRYSKKGIMLKIVMPKMQAEKLKGKPLYLYDQATHAMIDSVIVNGETSYINLTADSTFIPHLVSLKYNDTYKNFSYKRLLGFQNPYLAKTVNSFFYIDRGLTIIGTYYNDSNFVSSYQGSNQNEPYFRNISLSYSNGDTTGRSAITEQNIDLITKYSYSLHLLRQLFYYKDHFSNTDLRELLTHFDKDVKRTPLFRSFEKYFNISAGFDKAYPDKLQLQNTDGAFTQIGDEKASFNLFVIWASWCGPCREEIPELKEIYALYKHKGLSISSISIDNDKERWKVALNQEKMPWGQFIAVDSTRTLLDLYYNIKFIPKAYFFDKQKKLISRFDGSDTGLKRIMDSVFRTNKG